MVYRIVYTSYSIVTYLMVPHGIVMYRMVSQSIVWCLMVFGIVWYGIV